MIHEHIKNMALRNKAIDNVIFGESCKAHAFGVGGMAMDLEEDRLLIHLNGVYDADTDFTLYTESVKKAVDKCLSSFSNIEVNTLYRESKIKSILSKIWEWFKKVVKYLRDLPRRAWAYISKKFRAKKETATVKPTEATKKQAQTFMIAYDNTAKTRINAKESADKLIQRIEDGVTAGLKSIKYTGGDNIKYTSKDMKKLMKGVMTDSSVNKSLDTIRRLPEFDKRVYDEVKGTEYEIPFVSSAATMLLIHSGVMPYMPDRVEEYMASLGATPAHSFEKKIFAASTAIGGDGVAVNLPGLMSTINAHFNSVLEIAMKTEGGKSLADKQLLAIDKAEKYVEAVNKCDEAAEFMNSSKTLETFTNSNFVDSMTKLMAPFKSIFATFDPIVKDPKCILKKTTLSEFINNIGHYQKQREVLRMMDVYETFSDMFGEESAIQRAIKDVTEINRNIEEETAVKAINVMMSAFAPVTNIAAAMSKTFTLLFMSYSELEEEIVGFFGTALDINNVPITAMAKAIANDKGERKYILHMLGLE